ncbi:response regulator [Paenibacillus eucommiae]|uniref:Two-component system response regulator YesN n=1 Tax=Paenibacillus eucommiae TaxID=1355755 RepID=A0ABS4ISC0_9BACL|nr:response regulator [Paenibacillus eucommiae]MBP1990468.1 two-component system response regulator YesN [Paenibacillus eucommiae]
MYRMMIVDDLPIIVDRLVRLFGEHELLELEMYKAYSAFEAMDILKEIKMDIVLTDIKMPGMEGIELLHEIRKYWPKCKVIFLTSYDEFHYAKSAISGGGFDFILKFEKDEVIVKAIEKAIAALDDENATMKLLHQAQMQKRQVIPLLQEQYLHHLLYGKRVSLTGRMEEQFRETGIQLHHRMPVYMLMGRIDGWAAITAISDRKLMLYAIQNITAELLNISVAMVSVTLEESKILCLIQPKECSTALMQVDLPEEIWERTFAFVFGSLERIQSTCRDLCKLSLSFVLSEAPIQWSQLPESFDHLRSLFLRHAGAGKEMRLTDRTLDVDGSSAAAVQHKLQSFKVKKIELLGRFLGNGAKPEFDQLYEEIMNDTAQQAVSGFLKLEVYHSLASVFLSYFRLHPLDPSVFAKVELEKLTHANPDLSWEEMKDYFARLADHIFEHKAEIREPGKENIILWLNDHIEKHIAEDLSLTRLAEAVHLNPVYLSRLYMQTAGIGISDYVNLCRMDKAKGLLKNTHCKIYEIAEQVGYDSVLSFIRFFKKQMNMTPQEYRDL